MHVLEGAPHCFSGTQYEPEVFTDTIDWLQKHL